MKADSLTMPAQGSLTMRIIWAIAVLALTSVGTVSAQSGGTTSQVSATSGSAANQVAWLQYISAELRRVHIELLEQRRDLQQAKMQDLERELDAVRNQQQQLQEEQNSQTQQAADIEAQLVQPSLTKAEHEELEARRADLLALSPSRFGSVHNALAQRETRARERLALQEERVRALDQQLRELSAGSQ